MTSPRSLLVAAVVAVAVLGSAPGAADAANCPNVPDDAFAFIDAGDDDCTTPQVSWPAASVVFDCDFFTDGDKSIGCSGDDQTCVNLCKNAANIWNEDLPGRFRFVDHTDPVSFCDTEDGIVSVGGTTELCDGSSYGRFTLAVTLSIFFSSGPQAGELIDANITVNQGFEFSQKSFQATLAHEFGHALGLSHPDQCATDPDVNVLMRSASLLPSTDACFVLNPTQADVNGAELLYPEVQQICGDADQSGAITVTDGVQILRAAAELSSSCTLQRCDLDHSGAITVTDGVNVLRGAAGLPFTSQCP
jgi:hypothetical protein